MSIRYGRKEMRVLLLAISLAAAFACPAQGVDPIAYVNEALARGERAIRVPKDRYFVDLPADRTSYLTLKGLKDVTIDFQGGALIGKVRSRMLTLSCCTNVTVRNLTIDYETLPFTQAVIERVDAERNWDVRVIPGYPCPDDPDGKGCAEVWPVQAYDKDSLELKNPMRYLDGIAVRRTGPDTYRITGGTDRRGDVGDIAVWSIKDMTRRVEWAATWLSDCVTCTFEGVTVYSTPMGVGFMDIAGTANTYLRCVLDRCPPEKDFAARGLKRLRSGNHDAFNCRGSIRGFRVLDCTALYHCDDCINVSGWYAVVTEGTGTEYRVVGSAQALQIFPGDTVQVMTWDGRCLPDATVRAIVPDKGTTKDEMDFLLRQRMWPGVPKTASTGRRITFDRPVDLSRGAIICSNSRTSNGFIVRGNHFGRARARGIIVQASDGVVEDNLIEAPFDLGIKISMSYIWLEACCGKNVMVRNNRIVRPGRGTAIWVGGTPGKKGGCLLADSHRNISFISNRIENAAIGIDVLGCTDLTLRHNDIRPASGLVSDRVRLKNVADVHFREIRPAGVFASHMVVQRDRPIPVWGRGTPGDRLLVRFRGTCAETVVAADGTWRVELPAQSASAEGSRLTVVGGDDGMVFEDVLVGDVWMCSGQSNMEWPFGAHVLGEKEAFADSANYPNVRHLKISKVRATNVVEDVVCLPWRVCVGEKALGPVSAIGYYFARAVNRETGVPVGIVDDNWGGCSIDQFLPGGGQDLGMVRPLAPMRFAGALWYQGEANWGAVRYHEKLATLVDHWRTMWGRELPFYIAQLSSWRDPQWTHVSTSLDAPKQGFEWMRDVQLEMHRLLPRSGLVVTFDLGNERDVHFRNKLDVGERFARWALRDVYGRKDLVVSGPLFREVVREGGALRVVFDHVGSGLTAAEKDPDAPGVPPKPVAGLKGFVVSGVDGVWHPAEARIDGRSVVVSSSDVAEPRAVRYAYEAVPLGRANLYNREGLPASPFWGRTDLRLPDPSVFSADGKYRLVGTESRLPGEQKRMPSVFPLYASTNLVTWERVATPNGHARLLARKDAFGGDGFWAPQLFRFGSRYGLAYTADFRWGIATADRPEGPFKPRMAFPKGSGQAIDPYVFLDDDGRIYAYYSGTGIMVVELKPDLSGTLGRPTNCIMNDRPWEQTPLTSEFKTLNRVFETGEWESYCGSSYTVEGPTVLKRHGKYVLFYSANDFRSPDYCICVAVADSPCGPWRKLQDAPVVGRRETGCNGTGHGDVFFDASGAMWYVLHVHDSPVRISPRRTGLIRLEESVDADGFPHYAADVRSFRLLTGM